MKRRELTKDGAQWLVVQLPEKPDYTGIYDDDYYAHEEWQAECTRLQNAFPPILTNGGFPEGAKDLEEKDFRLVKQYENCYGWQDFENPNEHWEIYPGNKRIIAIPILKDETKKVQPDLMGIMRVLFEATLPTDMPYFDKEAEWNLFLFRNDLKEETNQTDMKEEVKCVICGTPINETGTGYEGKPCHIECYHAIKEANEVSATKESATAYLKSQGVDVDALVKRGLERIAAVKAGKTVVKPGEGLRLDYDQFSQKLFDYLGNELGVTPMPMQLIEIADIIAPLKYPYTLSAAQPSTLKEETPKEEERYGKVEESPIEAIVFGEFLRQNFVGMVSSNYWSADSGCSYKSGTIEEVYRQFKDDFPRHLTP